MDALDAPSHSQTVRAELRLREMILAADLAPGERIVELALVDKLGVSRTPIRAALLRLSQEGLLEPLSSGGYAVRTFTDQDVSDAIALRGMLEGLAARLAAERGCLDKQLAQAHALLVPIDALLASTQLDQPTHPRREGLRPFRAGLHVLGRRVGLEGAAMVTPGARDAGCARPSAKDHGAGRTVKFGDGHHDGVLHRQQAPT